MEHQFFFYLMALTTQIQYTIDTMCNRPPETYSVRDLLYSLSFAIDNFLELGAGLDFATGRYSQFVSDNGLTGFVAAMQDHQRYVDVCIHREMLIDTTHLVSVVGECLECIKKNDFLTK